jgi:predicted aspartyl protease
MKRRLSHDFNPPAPMVPVRIRAPRGLDAATLEGKLDTGADLCAVPEHYLVELDLPPIRTVRAAGFTGDLEEIVVYRVDVEIGDMSFPRVEALPTRRPYVILGRNVLRRLVMRVDGPAELLEVRLPRKNLTYKSRRKA